jgi:hypothetical protein
MLARTRTTVIPHPLFCLLFQCSRLLLLDRGQERYGTLLTLLLKVTYAGQIFSDKISAPHYSISLRCCQGIVIHRHLLHREFIGGT